MKRIVLFLIILATFFTVTLNVMAAEDTITIYFTTTNKEESLARLPETTANQVDPDGEWGEVSKYDFNSETKKFYFELNYDDKKYKVYDLSLEGDIEFLNKANKILYFTEKTSKNRILYFSFGTKSNSVLLMAGEAKEAENWQGEALWNLNTGEVNVIDVATIYNYIPEIDKDGNVFSYFYMPNILMEKLISVSLNLSYQYQKTGIFGWGGVGPLQTRSVMAINGETNSVNPTLIGKIYKGAFVTTAATALGVFTYGMLTATVPVYGWAVAGILGLVTLALDYADKHEFFAYDVEQIEDVTNTVDLATQLKINNYITQKSQGKQAIDLSRNKLHKLHLATLDPSKKPYIHTDGSNVTQVIYETNGQINIITEDKIIDVGWDGPGTIPDDISSKSVWEQFKVIIIVVGLALMAFKFKIFEDKKSFIFFALFTVLILFLTGILRI